jgi:hypothetical protein
MSQATYLRQHPEVESHFLPDGTCLLFDPMTNQGYTLNLAGALVWDYCDGALTESQIAQELVELLPQEPAVRAETEQLLRDLVERGLLVSVLPSDGPSEGEEKDTGE